jgi:hypothetical protein
MILDSLLSFSAAAGDLITTSGGVVVSTNVIDLGIGATATTGIPLSTAGGGARDIGIGDDPAMKILVQCGGTFAGGTSIIIALQGAVDDGTGSPAAFSTWWVSPTYLLAGLTAGTRLMDMDMPRPPAGVAVPRFLRLGYTVAGTFTGATSILKAYLVLDRDDQMYQSTNNAIMGGYPAGINVAN